MHNFKRPILLIEDNPMDVDLTKRAFARRNIVNPIEVARDGEEALAYLPRWQAGEPLPVVILLDLKLPKVDGLEVLRRLKTHPQLCTIPVVVLTSSAEDRDIQTAYELGANSYIVKPVDFEKFIEVAAHIEGRPTGRFAHPPTPGLQQSSNAATPGAGPQWADRRHGEDAATSHRRGHRVGHPSGPGATTGESRPGADESGDHEPGSQRPRRHAPGR